MDIQSLIYGGLSLASGVPMFLFPRLKREAAERAWANRLSELESGANEVIFEERRTLEAYPPYRTDRKWRIMGAALSVMGLALLYLAFFP